MLTLTASSDVPVLGTLRRVAACGELIACAHDDDSVQLWSVAGLASGTPPLRLVHAGRRRIDVLALAEDGTLFVGSRERLVLWRVRATCASHDRDAEGGQGSWPDELAVTGPALELDAHGMRGVESRLYMAVTCAAFQPSGMGSAGYRGDAQGTRRAGSLLAVGLHETVHIFERATGEETIRLEGHAAAVTACAFAGFGAAGDGTPILQGRASTQAETLGTGVGRRVRMGTDPGLVARVGYGLATLVDSPP
ncbi:hypothetical protein T492DRAFT_843942 [Pavlovales sp. CCMP2436]|nr:hypothetical protein T492DRAFT_843942 [Pavlovales sp. CCMP2436]